MALDHSRAATGVALADIQLGQARALTVLRQSKEEARLDHLFKLIQEWEPVCIVIGLPLDIDGHEQAQSKRVRKFAAKIGPEEFEDVLRKYGGDGAVFCLSTRKQIL